MGHTGAVAFIALTLTTLSLALSPERALAQDSTSDAKNPTRKISVPLPKPPDQWGFSLLTWTEFNRLTRADQTNFKLRSNMYGFGVERLWRQGNLRRGLSLEIQGFYARATTQSADAQITYLKADDSVFGLMAATGWRERWVNSRAEFSGLIGSTYRLANFTAPSGYNTDSDANKISLEARIDISVGLTAKYYLYQQITIPLLNAADAGNTWVFGLRL